VLSKQFLTKAVVSGEDRVDHMVGNAIELLEPTRHPACHDAFVLLKIEGV